MTGQAFQHTHRTLFICACKFAFTYEISIIYQLSAFDMCHDQKLDCIPILEDGRMVINSLIWIYIPIIRIPNMEWMTTNHILCFDPGIA